MRVFILALLCIISIATPTQAARNKGTLKWLESGRYKPSDFTQPNLNPATTPHTYLSNIDEHWTPQSWIIAAGSFRAVMSDLYKTGIIVAQDEQKGTPVLIVGSSFLSLGAQTQRRILEFIDHFHGITTSRPPGVIHLRHAETNTYFGSYTAHGLMLQ